MYKLAFLDANSRIASGAAPPTRALTTESCDAMRCAILPLTLIFLLRGHHFAAPALLGRARVRRYVYSQDRCSRGKTLRVDGWME